MADVLFRDEDVVIKDEDVLFDEHELKLLVVSDCANVQTAEAVEIGFVLVVGDGDQVNAAEAFALVQEHTLALSER